ncbi:NirD/YgiW/YdeI family stress tolerance protein [Azorhizophilus paspali]|uniref:NirD/YgiW/YdeI family stress tolerance protein n=1 Tax=Azorhizophilus paspali TaxID=69963 RepID=UPI003643A047
MASLIATGSSAAGYIGGRPGRHGTVSATREAADETPVTLEGRIVRQLKHEHYEFRERTGSIEVEIDDENWPATTIDEKRQVRLQGEVDRELFGCTIDVDFV